MFFIKKEVTIKSRLDWRALDERTSKSFLTDEYEFYGNVSENTFKVVKKPPKHIRNSFLPIVTGEFERICDGCLIHVKFRLHHLVSLFMLFWSIGAVIIPFLFGLIMLGPNTANGLIFLAFSIIMCAFEAFLLIIGFHFPSIKAINRLKEIFEAQE